MAADAPRGTVIVLSWDGRELLQRCLPPLLASLDRCEEPWQIVVVDNGSTDGSAKMVRTEFPTVRLIENEQNRGFSAAVNQGIAAARGDLIALLNNDVVVTERWLTELVSALDREPTVGSVAAQMRYLGRPEIINSAGIELDLTGRAFDRRDGRPACEEPTTPEPVFGASAGAALYRRCVLEQLGGFEERFFAYLEDVDLAWRAQRRGWSCRYVPTAIVLHEHSATTDRISGLRTYLSVRNHWWLLARNASAAQVLVAGPLILTLAAWTVVVSVARREAAGLRGLRDALTGLPDLVRVRPTGGTLPLSGFVAPRLFRHRRSVRVMRGLRSQ